ncbi:hypothetical protein LVJ94_38195 [Pendulispora rubella]|uniref:Lipoprotein n=1 Tax=Pendulispora rubella TaxID=2741070 RepID=A0ABZ2KYT3_9BACT
MKVEAFLFSILAAMTACSSNDDGDSKEPPPGEQEPGRCSGDITNCALGALSDAQKADMCNLTLEAIDSSSGAKFECKSGPQSGQYLQVNAKNECVAQKFPASCSITVSELLKCYKAAKADACAAFEEGGACTAMVGRSQECT